MNTSNDAKDSEKLMKSSDQKDESKNTNLGGVLVENLMGGDTRKVGNYPVDKAKQRKQRDLDEGTSHLPAYQPGAWTHSAPVEFTVKAWEGEKAKAVANGLADKATGISKAIKAAVKLYDAAKEAMPKDPIDLNIPPRTPKEGKERKAKLVKAKAALAAVTKAIDKCRPVSNRNEDYPEMVDYLVELRSQAMTRYNEIDRLLTLPAVGAKKLDWQPPQDGFAAAPWAANWKDAVEKCMLPKSDAGVHAALIAAAAAHDKVDQAKKRSEKWAAFLKWRDRHKDLIAALNACEKICVECDGMLLYVQSFISHVINAAQDLNKELLQKPWPDGPANKDDGVKFSLAGVKAILQSAKTEGYNDGNDHGLADAFKAYETSKLAYEKVARPDAKAKARALMIAKLIDIAKRVDKFNLNSSDTHPDFISYLAFIAQTARAECGKQRDEFAKVDFAYKAGLTPNDWQETYENAVREGAVARDDEVKEGLSSSFALFQNARNAFINETANQQRKRIKGEAVKASLDRIKKSSLRVSNAPGWEHPTVLKYLGEIEEGAKAALKEKALDDVLKGNVDDSTLPVYSEFHWRSKDWSELKDQAVKLGLLPKKVTGFGKAIDAAQASFDKWDKAKPDKKPALRDQAVADLAAAEKSVEALRKLTENKKIVAYLDLFGTKAKERKTALG